jgi:hypothetical protein
MAEEKIIDLIFGKRGSGKSVLASSLIRDQKRVLIYDTLGEYTEGVIIESYPELCKFWAKVYRQNFRIIYQPLDPDGDFETVCDLVFNCGNITYLVEEIDCFCSAQALGINFKSIIQRGRHKDITLIGITQRPAGIARLITSQAKAMRIFNTTEPRDIDYFRQILGEALIKKLAELKEYEYVLWQDGVDELVISRA